MRRFHAEAAPGELAALVARCRTAFSSSIRWAALDAALDLRDATSGIAKIVCFDGVAAAETGDPMSLPSMRCSPPASGRSTRTDAPWRSAAWRHAGGDHADFQACRRPRVRRNSRMTRCASPVDAALVLIDLRAGEEGTAVDNAGEPRFERVFGFCRRMVAGVTVNFPESAETIPENLRELQPQIVSGARRRCGAASRRWRAPALRRSSSIACSSAMHGSGAFGSLVLKKVRRDIGLSRAPSRLSAGRRFRRTPPTGSLRSASRDGRLFGRRSGRRGDRQRGRAREFSIARGASFEIDADGRLLRSAALLRCAHLRAVAARKATGSRRATWRRRRRPLLCMARAMPPSAAPRRRGAVEDGLALAPTSSPPSSSGDAPDRLAAVIFADYDQSFSMRRRTPYRSRTTEPDGSRPKSRALIGQEVERINAALKTARIADFSIADRPVGRRSGCSGRR